jgi:hypothetical protein
MTINPQLLHAKPPTLCHECGAALSVKQIGMARLLHESGVHGIKAYCMTGPCYEKNKPQGKHVFQKKQGVKTWS